LFKTGGAFINKTKEKKDKWASLIKFFRHVARRFAEIAVE
jgi:hypothetical protein